MHFTYCENGEKRWRSNRFSDRVRMEPFRFFSLQANTPARSTMVVEWKQRVISTSKVCYSVESFLIGASDLLRLEPQWRFETKLPATLEGDPGETIELECSVQDEDAECEWSFAGEVSEVECDPRAFISSFRSSNRMPIRIVTKSFRSTKFENWS